MVCYHSSVVVHQPVSLRIQNHYQMLCLQTTITSYYCMLQAIQAPSSAVGLEQMPDC